MRMTRRSAIAVWAGLAAGKAVAHSEVKATAFALIGDRYHNPDYIRVALGKTLVEGAGLSIDFSDELKALNAGKLAGYKLLIVFRDGMIWPDGYPDQNTYPGYAQRGSPEIVSDPPLPEREARRVYWITPEQGKAVKEFASNGGGVLFYHNVTYISPHNDDFRDVLGAVTLGHPPIRKFKVKIIDKDHPVTRGVKDFVVTDEQHYMVFEKDEQHVLMRSVNEDGLTHREHGASAPAGWAFDYGKGRVCYLGPGHMITALWNPEYVKIQKNAVRWLLRET